MIETENLPKIKLFTLWTRRDTYHTEIDEHNISHGIWEAQGVDETEKGRIYTFKCMVSNHAKLRVGSTRKMHEIIILALCHPVSFIVHPKLVEKEERELQSASYNLPVRGDEVMIVYKKEDLENIELGVSGITLESNFKKFGSFLNCVFIYIGTLKENENFCLIGLKKDQGEKEFLIHKNCIKVVRRFG